MSGSSWGLSRGVTGSSGWFRSTTHAGSGPAAATCTSREDSQAGPGRASRVRSRWAGAASVVLVLGLSGCGSTGATAESGEPSPAASSTTPSSGTTVDASPSPTSTLTPEEQEAFEDATNTVVAYRQTVIDLLSGARTELNDLNDVVTGDLLDDDLKNMQQSITAGRTVDPGSKVVLVSAQPVTVGLDEDPETVRIRACIDLTGITFHQPDGSENAGTRGQADYVLVRTDYLPAPGWAVSQIKAARNEADRSC